jgi:dTDP-4-amino-4,6-dideoxygalactose transaminase
MMPVPRTSARLDIPLHRVSLEPADLDAVRECLAGGALIGDGPSGQRLAARARSLLNCAYAAPTPSGTHALELMMRALPIAPGDEVICPSFTFVSAANAVVLAGGTPVFADVDADTLNLDAADAERRLSPRTRAIVTAHYGGIASQLPELAGIAARHAVALLEDAAHALGGGFDGRALGTWGRAAAFSFHATKNLVAGEGGLFVTSDEAMARRAEIVREKGTDRSRFVRGEVDKYTWQAVGSSYLMGDLLSALIASQWQRIDSITAARRERFERYQAGLEPLDAAGVIRRPRVPPGCEPAYHLSWLRVESPAVRSRLAGFLRERGIEASSHFVPLHTSPYAREHLGTRPGTLPVTEDVATRLLRLPLYPSLSVAEQSRVIDSVSAFFGRG